jgi:hypothetical protein
MFLKKFSFILFCLSPTVFILLPAFSTRAVTPVPVNRYVYPQCELVHEFPGKPNPYRELNGSVGAFVRTQCKGYGSNYVTDVLTEICIKKKEGNTWFNLNCTKNHVYNDDMFGTNVSTSYSGSGYYRLAAAATYRMPALNIQKRTPRVVSSSIFY